MNDMFFLLLLLRHLSFEDIIYFIEYLGKQQRHAINYIPKCVCQHMLDLSYGTM